MVRLHPLTKCVEFSVPTAVQSLSEDLLKYYQQITRAILGEDLHLMKVRCCWEQTCYSKGSSCSSDLPLCVFQVALLDLQSNSKIAALLPYFVYVISGVCVIFFFFTVAVKGL